uniref:Uncharacterized protein n=1 Tax=Leersia perrieri TaxID=77586 RepID=A0A0D9XVN4_9ORYZ
MTSSDESSAAALRSTSRGRRRRRESRWGSSYTADVPPSRSATTAHELPDLGGGGRASRAASARLRAEWARTTLSSSPASGAADQGTDNGASATATSHPLKRALRRP